MTARFVPNPGFERELQAEPRLKAFVEDAADEVAAVARSLAPVRTGYYRRHIGDPGPIVAATDVFYWHFIEYGTKKIPARAPLRRAVRAAGLRLRAEPKR